jgi:hypothetical protein
LVILNVPFSIRCNSTINTSIEAGIIALKISIACLLNDALDVVVLVLQRKLLGYKQVIERLGPFSIRCNSTTNTTIEAGIIALEIYISLFSNDVLDVVVLVLQRKLLDFKQDESRLDFNW